jgi:hypothetical protein
VGTPVTVESGLGGDAEPAPAPAETPDGKKLRSADAVAPLAAAALIGVALALLAALGAAREPELRWNEVMLFRSRPRKAVHRYALTLGLWELSRKTTFFAVTTRRLIVERGLVRRHTRSIPLSAIVDVDLVEGLWEGKVRISERGDGSPDGVVEIGPLRAPEARRLAAMIASHAGA